MSLSSLWFRQPQKVWLRRALFQIHLWTGIAAGLYILVVSVTGSAVVFRNEIYLHLDTPPILVTPVGEHLPREALNEAVAAQHPGFRIRTVFSQRNPNRAIEIWLARDDEERQRLFDPYTGEDLGRSVSIPIEITSWLLDLQPRWPFA
jgi:uncharacterized iron-regulated membrane protein